MIDEIYYKTKSHENLQLTVGCLLRQYFTFYNIVFLIMVGAKISFVRRQLVFNLHIYCYMEKLVTYFKIDSMFNILRRRSNASKYSVHRTAKHLVPV